MDMAVLVESQGEQLDNIEEQVERASSFVRGGTQHLEVAKKTQRNTRKWYCYGIILILIVVLIIVLSIRPWEGNGKSSSSSGNSTPAVSSPPPPPPGSR